MESQNDIANRLFTADQEKQMVNQLIVDEAYKEFPYDDATGERVYAPQGKITIGIGINLDDGLSLDESTYLCKWRLRGLQVQLLTKLPFYNSLDIVRKMVLLNMAYNMGIPRLFGFKNMLAAIAVYNWDGATKELLDSKAARQLPNRYKKLASMMQTGKLYK